MSIVKPADLKDYFKTGDVPTQSNFGDLIDSSYNKAEGGIISKGASKQQLTGKVSLKIDKPKIFTKIIIGTNTQFTKELWIKAPLKVGGNTYHVESIANDITLKIKETPKAAFTNETAYNTSGNFFTAVDEEKKDVMQVDSGGNVTATSFTGTGSGLTGISAANITGTLPSSNNVFFYTDSPCVMLTDGEATVKLYWKADSGYTLTLTYITDFQVQTSTLSSDSGNNQYTIWQDTVFTLTATKGETVMHRQLHISVLDVSLPELYDYIQNKMESTTMPKKERALVKALVNIIKECAGGEYYRLETLTFDNLVLFSAVLWNSANAVFGADQTTITKSDITSALASYYQYGTSVENNVAVYKGFDITINT